LIAAVIYPPATKFIKFMRYSASVRMFRYCIGGATRSRDGTSGAAGFTGQASPV
jgi:hypothetical protein